MDLFKLLYKNIRAVPWVCVCLIIILTFLWLFPLRGDIVIAKSPSDPKSNICKRVIGLEGDKILTNSPSGFFKGHSYVSNFSIMLFIGIIVD